MITKIDERVTIQDEHDFIAAACGHNPACYEDIRIRRYVIETSIAGFSFSVDEKGNIMRVTQLQRLVSGVDIL